MEPRRWLVMHCGGGGGGGRSGAAAHYEAVNPQQWLLVPYCGGGSTPAHYEAWWCPLVTHGAPHRKPTSVAA